MERNPQRNPDRTGSLTRSAAIVVPWLCATAFPVVKLGVAFCSLPRLLFFDFVMMPFCNIAFLGLTANGQDRTVVLIAVFVLAGIVLPPLLALLFVRFWKRWQFVIVWLAYLALVAWDTLIATGLATCLMHDNAQLSQLLLLGEVLP